MKELILILSLTVAFLVMPGKAASQSVHLPSGDECVAGQVIVKLDSGTPGTQPEKLPVIDELCQRWDIRSFKPMIRGRFKTGLLYLVSFDPGADVQQVVSDFDACPGIAYACPNVLIPLDGQRDETPNDPRFAEQWYLDRIRAPQAWNLSHGDSSVVIAVIDDGLRYNHQDIEANVWINPAEDINHNRRFDLLPPPGGDLDGIDQDSNGYVDDVIGYDFLDDDPNPIAGTNDNHGTHGWGVANAVTDNGLGISAPAWNVRGMALRCGGSGNIDLAAAVEAIYYSIGKGAWVVSMGWGLLTPYAPLEAACTDAWESGSLIVASAGSQSGSAPIYPASYPNVIAIAASDRNDMRASFTGYGAWVDLCAPGLDILSTADSSSYQNWSGTAGATQLTAGVLCWLKSAYPTLTNDSALTILLDLCDSMPDPSYPQGLLGAGRLAMVPDSTNRIDEEQLRMGICAGLRTTIVRGYLLLPQASSVERQTASVLLNISGRKVLDLHPGANDVSRLAPGIYFLKSGLDRLLYRITILN
jgi:subtilisin family serine protease